MKKTKTILTVISLMLMVINIKAQEVKEIAVYKDGNILYRTNLAVSDSIRFSKFTVPNTLEGIEINGIIWATANVAAPGTLAANSWDAGMFYQWNRPIGWSSSDPLENHEGGTVWDDSTPEGDTWETGNNVCPSGWRAPTQEEFESLINSGSLWGTFSGVSGRFFGNGNQRLFLPAAGTRFGSAGNLYDAGSDGYYWSGTPEGDDYASLLYFRNRNAETSADSRSHGLSVRCVLSEP